MHAISLISLALMLSRFVLCVHIALRDAFNLTLAGLIVAVSIFKSRLPLPFVRPLCTARNFWAFSFASRSPYQQRSDDCARDYIHLTCI